MQTLHFQFVAEYHQGVNLSAICFGVNQL